jgi:hypothetical protein
MDRMKFYTLISFLLLTLPILAQQPQYVPPSKKGNYVSFLDDARLDIGVKAVTVFALDDRAPLSSNPHFQAMWNLIKLGASLEALLQGVDDPLNDIDLNKKFGHNGYNKTIPAFFISYGFGESSDVKLQTHFFELSASPGHFREGKGGMNIHMDYRVNFLKTNYGAGGNSLDRTFNYEIFVGGRIGFDWSSGRSESEAGFFTHLNDEIKRIAEENELTVAQLLMLEELAESSKILLPEDVGGSAFHAGPIAGAYLSTKIMGSGNIFLGVNGFYDLMDIASPTQGEESKRSQHQLSLILGGSFSIGSNGNMNNTLNSFF